MKFHGLAGKVAVVTGSASGLGRQISLTLAKQDIIVVGIDRDDSGGAKTEHLIRESGGSGYYKKVDLSDTRDISRLFSQIRSEFGTIHILVNNAGISHPMSFSSTTTEIWNQMLAVNLTATFLCIKEVVDEMAKKRYGKIVNISSRSGIVGSKGFAAYSASKFGQIGLTQCVANEYAPYNVNVNAVCPGIVYTPMWEKQLDDYIALKGCDSADVRQELVKKIPMGRLQTEEDIANTVLFLVSDMSCNITGQSLMVTGGY